MHGQAVIAGTRVPVGVILDRLAAGMPAEEITAEYPMVTVAGVCAAAAYGAALAREGLLRRRNHGEVQARREPARLVCRNLDQCDQNVDIVTDEGLTGAPDHDVVAAATVAGLILISLDRGLGDIRAYPPGSHAGIVVLRLTDQSATAATKPVSDLATPHES